jgi:hypothetical protein
MRLFQKQPTTRVCLLLAILALALSCVDDRNAGYEKYFLAYGTAERPAGGDLFIVLDDNDTTLLVSESAVPVEFFKDKMRLFVDYSILERATPDQPFHYNARVNRVQEIPTKDVLWETASDTTGGDPLAVENYWLAHGFLTVKYRVRGASRPHDINLVRVYHPNDNKEESIIYFDLRHDALDDPDKENLTGRVSFPLYKAFPETVDPVKLRISYNDAENSNGKTSIEITYYPLKQP